MSQNIDLVSVAKLWTEHFGKTPDDLLQAAFHLVLKDAEYWPTVKDIKGAITELTTQLQLSCQTHTIALNAPEMSDDTRKDGIDKIKKIKELLASRDTAGLKEIAGNANIEHLRGYAKSLFPDISDKLIQDNFGVLDYAKTAKEDCDSCGWYDASKCPTGGYYPVPRIEKAGYIKFYMAQCERKALSIKQKTENNFDKNWYS